MQAYGDSELVINQVRGLYTTKNDLLKSYKHRVWDLIEYFQAFNLLSIPRNLNKHVDRLATIGAQCNIPSDSNNINKHQYV